VSAWAAALRDATDPQDVQVEDKGFTLALHYRRSRNMEETRRRLCFLVHALPGTKVVGGHAVLNVIPEHAPTKKDAVARFSARFPGRPVVFVGDDDVDEEAFQAAGVTLPIRVGLHPGSAARYVLRDQGCVDALLQQMITATRRADGLSEEWLAPSPGERGRGR
jgi:trehalose-phosphatase